MRSATSCIGPMLAHKAEDEGVAVAEVLAGQHGHVNYNVIPGVVYTNPEIASVGATEDDLKPRASPTRLASSPHGEWPRAIRKTDGMVKILADAATDRVLGAHILGFGAGKIDRGSLRPDGIRWFGGRSGADVPRPSHHVRSGQGSGSGGR